jgi:hypothetical protein
MISFNTSALKALFTYPFRQPNWQSKLLVLGLLYFAGFIIPIVPWVFALGYMAELMRRQALEGGEPQLPEWADWGRLGMDGLRLGVISLVMSLPTVAIFAFGMGAYFLSFVPMMASDGNNGAIFGLTILAMIIMTTTIVVGNVVAIGLGVVSPAVMTHAAVKRSFSALFEVREWWGVLRANLGGYAIAFALVLAVSYSGWMISTLLFSTLICCALAPLVLFAMLPYISVITSVVFGQVYREGQLKRAEGQEPPAEAVDENPPQTSEA